MTSPANTDDRGELLRKAARWLGEAQDAVARSEWAEAETALSLAESAYGAARETEASTDADPDEEEMLAEGAALCTLLRSDMALRFWQLSEAETHLDAAYEVLKQGEGLGVELWRLTGRLAERRGRWTSAYAAWKKVAKTMDGKDERKLADAWVRLAEIALIQGKTKAAQDLVLKLDPLARDLDDPLLKARVLLLRAGEMELTGELQPAAEMYRDAERLASEDAPADFMGLLKVRMAATEAVGNPRKAVGHLRAGLEDLQKAAHPDALGLVLSQLAIVALLLRQPAVAALAAMSAETARGGRDGTSRPLLSAALKDLEHEDYAREVLDLELDVKLHKGVARALDPTMQQLGLRWDEMGLDSSIDKLAGSLQGLAASGVQVRVEDAVVVNDRDALFRQRASLCWDAPQGRLKTRAPPPPALPAMPKLIAATAPRPPVRQVTIDQEHARPVVNTSASQLASVSLGLVFVVSFAFAFGIITAAIVLKYYGF